MPIRLVRGLVPRMHELSIEVKPATATEPAETATGKFLIKPMTQTEFGSCGSLLANGNLTWAACERACRIALIGWEGIIDPDGTEVPFTKSAALELPAELQIIIGREAMSASCLEAPEAKN